MRKLILTSIRAITGDHEWTEERLVVVNQKPGDLEEDLRVKATRAAERWLANERPHSKYISIVAKSTIGEDPDPESAPDEPKQFLMIFHIDDSGKISPLKVEDWDKGDRFFNSHSEAERFIKTCFKDVNNRAAYTLVILPVYSVESRQLEE